MNNCYLELASAIIVQACKDYRNALKVLQKASKAKDALKERQEIERFFRSSWFSALTELNGELLMQKLKEEVWQ